MESSQIYCLKCRGFTNNADLHTATIVTKGKDRLMEKAICTICGKKKNRFVKSLPPIQEILKQEASAPELLC